VPPFLFFIIFNCMINNFKYCFFFYYYVSYYLFHHNLLHHIHIFSKARQFFVLQFRWTNQWLQTCLTTPGTNGKSTGTAWSLSGSWATASSAKSGKESGTTRPRWPSRHSSLVRLHQNKRKKNRITNWVYFSPGFRSFFSTY